MDTLRITESEDRWLLLLSMVPGLGMQRIKALLTVFGSAREAARASRSDLLAVPGIGPVLAQAISDTCQYFDLPQFERQLEQAGISYITWLSRDYPQSLRQLKSPPPVLFYQGQSELLARPLLAVVGTRKPPVAMSRWLENLCAKLAEVGIVIVSGLARGIDGAAHRGALRTGSTVAVLGSGLRYVYPAEHRVLARQIAQNGLVLTEYPPATKVRAQSFPARNRIIAGLAEVVLVAAAGEKSGAMITAEFARQEGKTVLGIPGAPYDSAFAGVNQLLAKRLAQPVYDVEGILVHMQRVFGRDFAELHSTAGKKDSQCVITVEGRERAAPDESGSKDDQRMGKLGQTVLQVLSEPLSAEELLTYTGLEPSTLWRVLTELEIAGKVVCSESGLWSRL